MLSVGFFFFFLHYSVKATTAEIVSVLEDVKDFVTVDIQNDQKYLSCGCPHTPAKL